MHMIFSFPVLFSLFVLVFVIMLVLERRSVKKVDISDAKQNDRGYEKFDEPLMNSRNVDESELNITELKELIEKAAASHDVHLLKTLSSRYGAPLKKSGMEFGCNHSNPVSIISLLSSRKHMEILCSALLKVPDRIMLSVETLKELKNGEDSSLSRFSFMSLLKFRVLSGLPLKLHNPYTTVYLEDWMDATAAWCARTMSELANLGADLLTPGFRLNAGENGWTILHYTCSGAYGSPSLTKWLLKQPNVIKCINIQTSYYMYTPLHLAALCVEGIDTVQALLEAGADILLTDRYGRTAGDLSVQIVDKKVVEFLAVSISNDLPVLTNNAASKNANFSSITTSNDVTTKIQDLFSINEDLSSAAACIDKISACSQNASVIIDSFLPLRVPEQNNWHENLLPTECISDSSGVIRLSISHLAICDQFDYIVRYGMSLNRPLVISGIDFETTRKKWSKSAVLEKYGNLKFSISGIPHSEGYGGNPSKQNISISEFVNKWPEKDVNGDVMYLFCTSNPTNLPCFWDDFNLPDFMTPVVESGESFTFYCGPRLSGAPFHDHTSAWNVCIYGYKRWFLLPPGKGILSRKHIFKWLDDEGFQEKFVSLGGFQFIQGPGDLVFIPPHWSHAVLNLTEVVGFASEFPAYMYPPNLDTNYWQ